MTCPHCQRENAADARFCSGCGRPLELTCPACGTANSEDSRFCKGCGKPLLRFAAPQSYTPRHLAEKILTSRSALEGERKQVTVLFADLKGSMELLADRDPEEARKLLDPVLERMMEAVHRYEGTVNQVMGDGIMALFGAPLAHEDHAVRACYAALRMQEGVGRYAEELRRSQGLDVQIRIGLNSGDVVVRSIGSDLHMDYTAVGQTTHLAARMEQLARPGTTLLTADTLRLAEGYIEVRPLGPVPVKGLADPVETYEVLRVGLVRSRLQAAAKRGLTRFVGRDAEVDQLRQALERGRDGHGQVVAVVGEPGVGKSRLFYEFAHSHRTQGWLILESGSASYGKATPYLPVIDLLKGYFQIEARDDARKMREKITGKLLTLDEALRPSLPALLALLEVPVEDPQWEALDTRQRRQRTLDGVRRLLLRESQTQPLCLIFEDLHWIDSETQAFLDGLIESLPTARLLLLANYRPEYQHGWASKTYYTQLRLDPLRPESAEQLLRSLLGADAGLKPLKRLLIERTEGNPFFLEESVRTLVETKALVGEGGAYRLATGLVSIQVPATVQAVLAARIDRLPPEDKRLLQSASVIGESVPFGLLQAVMESPEEELRHGLSRLQAVEFLYETSLFPDLEYTFKHALTYQVAYTSLLADRRRTLHARILEAIESLYADRLGEQVDRLAHHAFRGEVWDRALAYLRQAGGKAAMRSAHREAVACFEQALGALGHLPRARHTLEQAIDIRFDLRNSHLSLGEHERILEHLRAAEPLAQALGDHRRLGRLFGYLSTYFFFVGEHYKASVHGERALAAARSLGDLALQAEMNQRVAFVCYARGDYRQAMDLTRWNVQALTGDLTHTCWTGPNLTSVVSRAWLGRCLSEQGDFGEAIRLGEEAVRIAETVTSTDSLTWACWAAGSLYFLKGDLHKAISALERSLGICRAAGIGLAFPLAASYLGSSYALSGRVAEALPLLEQAVQQTGNFGVDALFIITSLSEGYLLAGRIEEAAALAERALGLSRERKEPGREAWASRLLGEIASHRDPPGVETAEGHYRGAMSLAEELRMRPLVAHSHLGLGKLYRGTGKRHEAQEHLTTAQSMYREMNMGFWLEKAEAEIGPG